MPVGYNVSLEIRLTPFILYKRIFIAFDLLAHLLEDFHPLFPDFFAPLGFLYASAYFPEISVFHLDHAKFFKFQHVRTGTSEKGKWGREDLNPGPHHLFQ